MKTYKVTSHFADGTSQTEATGFTTREKARIAALRIWREKYNEGRSRHTPILGHNSGIVDIGTEHEGVDPDDIRDALEAAGITRQELANRMGVSRRQVYNYLSGETALKGSAEVAFRAVLKEEGIEI